MSASDMFAQEIAEKVIAALPLGRFENEVDAARAYDSAAVEHFGEFACTNLSATVSR